MHFSLWRSPGALVCIMLLSGGCHSPARQLVHAATVPMTAGQSTVLTVTSPMVFSDDRPDGQQAVRLLPGEYLSEAQDAQYIFYRSPNLIEYRQLENRQVVDGKNSAGGVAVAKEPQWTIPPYGVYMDGEKPGEKIIIFALGTEFQQHRLRSWSIAPPEQ